VPEAFVFFTLNDSKDLPLIRLLLGYPSIGEAAIQMLRPVVFAMFRVEIAVLGCSVQPEADLGQWNSEAVRDPTPPCLLL
jgi:hypothetical protein